MTDDLAIVGTMEGYLYALQLAGASADKRMAWKFRAYGAVNTQVALANDCVFFGCNGGSIYCLDEKTGAPIWERCVGPVEHRARKHFTTPHRLRRPRLRRRGQQPRLLPGR